MREDELARARYRKLVRRLENLMRDGAWERGSRRSCGSVLIEPVELERIRREGLPLGHLRRAAREAGENLGWHVATHLDAVGRLWLYDASTLVDEDLTVFGEAL